MLQTPALASNYLLRLELFLMLAGDPFEHPLAEFTILFGMLPNPLSFLSSIVRDLSFLSRCLLPPESNCHGIPCLISFPMRCFYSPILDVLFEEIKMGHPVYSKCNIAKTLEIF